VSVNPYRPTESAARALLVLGVAKLEKGLEKAEREVERRSEAARLCERGPRQRAAARARLTTACEVRDRYAMALRLAREEVSS